MYFLAPTEQEAHLWVQRLTSVLASRSERTIQRQKVWKEKKEKETLLMW